MMRTCRRFATTVVLATALVFTGSAVQAQCNPGIGPAFAANAPVYTALLTSLAPTVPGLTAGIATVVDQPTYANFLTFVRAIAPTVPNGRVVITLPDGTVMIDTARPDDPTNVMAVGNSFAHFNSKTVNENHNSRIAILDAQEWPCGVGIERKLSSSTGLTETYMAFRLGTHLDSLGTARLSTRP